tara:strand:+ start:16997 stop:17206 length:210 start_codon:yes stop_codon:yes gene_type:complete
MKVKTKISRYIFLKIVKRGILRGGPVWFSMGVLATFLKIISVFEDREKKYLSLQLKPGDNVSYKQSLQR